MVVKDKKMPILSICFVTIPLSLLTYKQLHVMSCSCFFVSVYAGLRSLLIFLECCLLSYVCSVLPPKMVGVVVKVVV